MLKSCKQAIQTTPRTALVGSEVLSLFISTCKNCQCLLVVLNHLKKLTVISIKIYVVLISAVMA